MDFGTKQLRNGERKKRGHGMLNSEPRFHRRNFSNFYALRDLLNPKGAVERISRSKLLAFQPFLILPTYYVFLKHFLQYQFNLLC